MKEREPILVESLKELPPGPSRSEDSRGKWLQSLACGDAENTIFQIEVRLKAVDRFFNPKNHPARRDGQITFHHDLKVEVVIVDRQLRALIQLVQGLLEDPNVAGAAVFQRYLEAHWLTDEQRDELLRRHRTQETPSESLRSLLVDLRSLAQLTGGLRLAENIRLPTFLALADQYRKVISLNRYFSPLNQHSFYPIATWLDHTDLKQSIRGAPTGNLRRALGFSMLVFGRYVTILDLIKPEISSRKELIDALPLFALLRSEFRVLRHYFEDNLAQRFFARGPESDVERSFLSAVDSFAFQLAAEEKKAFDVLLLDYVECTRVEELRSRIEAVRQLLMVFFENAAEGFVKVVSPELAARDIFPDVALRFEQSARLREDLWIFGELIAYVTACIGDDDIPASEHRRHYRALLDFLTYFENLSFQSVRFTESDSFRGFFDEIRTLRDESFADRRHRQDIVGNFECFRIFIEMARGAVSQRAELRDVPLDTDHARQTLHQFLARH